MANVEYESRENWHDLHLLIDDYFTHYNDYIFRGQADREWKLESSLTRAIRNTHASASDKDVRFAVDKHFDLFKRSIRGRSNFDLIAASDDIVWSLGQHFGLYTPLLDWSRSPYVALFFSFFGPCNSGRRTLWAICEEHIPVFWPKRCAEERLRIVEPLSHDNPRLVSQNGLFLDIPVGKSADEMIFSKKEINNNIIDEVSMYRIDFPDSIRWDALAASSNMNISHASLFPDVYGASLFANASLEIQPYLINGRSIGFVGD